MLANLDMSVKSLMPSCNNRQQLSYFKELCTVSQTILGEKTPGAGIQNLKIRTDQKIQPTVISCGLRISTHPTKVTNLCHYNKPKFNI